MRVERLQQEYDIEVEWRGLEIHPELPRQGVSRRVFLGERFGQADAHLLGIAAQEALRFVLPEVISNSHAALEASELARDKGVFPVFHHRVFEAYFQEGQNISDPLVLAALGEEAGLDPAELEAALAGQCYEGRLAQSQREAQDLFITGVPTFIIGGQRVVGAQPYAVLCRAVELAGAARGRPQGEVTG